MDPDDDLGDTIPMGYFITVTAIRRVNICQPKAQSSISNDQHLSRKLDLSYCLTNN